MEAEVFVRGVKDCVLRWRPLSEQEQSRRGEGADPPCTYALCRLDLGGSLATVFVVPWASAWSGAGTEFSSPASSTMGFWLAACRAAQHIYVGLRVYEYDRDGCRHPSHPSAKVCTGACVLLQALSQHHRP